MDEQDLDQKITARGSAPKGSSMQRSLQLMPRRDRGLIGAAMRRLEREHWEDRAEDYWEDQQTRGYP